jgi:hypothetical protein
VQPVMQQNAVDANERHRFLSARLKARDWPK